MTSQSDTDLVRQIASGDEEAFETLYARHSTAVYNYLLRLVSRTEIAEELLQDVFIAVWQQAALFQGRAAVKTWVFRIAHNKAVSWLRSRKEPESLDVVARGQTPQRTFSGTQPSLDGLDDREALARALAYLSPKHRAVIELAFGQQMTYKEIALVMECPEGTVKSRMKHALQSLERILQRDGYER